MESRGSWAVGPGPYLLLWAVVSSILALGCREPLVIADAVGPKASKQGPKAPERAMEGPLLRSGFCGQKSGLFHQAG